ncbi:MAG TPA: Maf family protein, partial [Burkholderiales bacterium]|nr:Maf family protein [Burkholderiales bacterium]
MAEKRIYLASRSPRRRELLKQIGVNFELLLLREDPKRGSDVDETPLPDELADAYALRIAGAKAENAALRVAQRSLPRNPVLVADTTVVLDGQILGKPADAGHAIQMLQALSGREHKVITVVAMAKLERVETRMSVSTVQFRELSETEIRRYVAGGEPLDKAGAYAIQGRAAVFITRIEGSYSGI